MTPTEYEAWKLETEKSNGYWTLDEVMLHNNNYMFYIGGVNGKYIFINNLGGVSLGDYVGAIPHIAEAAMTVRWTKTFKDQNEALTYVLNRAGMPIFRTLAFGRDPYRTF